MYRAASTWQYNVVSHLVETFGVGRRIGYFTETEGEKFRTHYAQHADSHQFLVLKSHHRHPEFANALAERCALGVYIYRDLRDVAFSLAHRFNTTFEAVVREKRLIHHSIENDEFWRSQPRMILQQYEQVIKDPITAIVQLAKHLGLEVSSEYAEQVADQYSFSSNFERTRAVAERFVAQGIDLSDPQHGLSYDEQTLFGWNHLRDGRAGGWRDEATPEQLLTLLAACGAWLVLRGYEPDCSWAWTGWLSLKADQEGTDWALRGLLRWCEADGKQVVRLQQEIEGLTRRFHDVSTRVHELEQLSSLIRKQAAWLQALFVRFPRIRDLLRSVSSRSGASPGLRPTAEEDKLS
jgi:hypothetical protein